MKGRRAAILRACEPDKPYLKQPTFIQRLNRCLCCTTAWRLGAHTVYWVYDVDRVFGQSVGTKR